MLHAGWCVGGGEGAGPPTGEPRAMCAPCVSCPATDIKDATGEGDRPLYVVVNGLVFDMRSHESGMTFYGPGSSYHCFAGR